LYSSDSAQKSTWRLPTFVATNTHKGPGPFECCWLTDALTLVNQMQIAGGAAVLPQERAEARR